MASPFKRKQLKLHLHLDFENMSEKKMRASIDALKKVRKKHLKVTTKMLLKVSKELQT